jgi:hypothetical protein
LSTTASTPSSPAAPATPAAPVASTPEVAQGGQPDSGPQKSEIDFDSLTDEQVDKILRKRKHKVKVDKKEEEIDYDELKAGYQLKKHSHKQLQEVAESRKQIESLLATISTDPITGLQKLLKHPSINKDMRQVATEYLARELEREAMDPKEREAQELREKLAEYERQDSERKKAEEDREAKEYRARLSAQYERDILAAIEPSGLPATEQTFGRVVYYMRAGLERGMNITPEAAAKLVREDYEREHRELLGKLDPEKLAGWLGEDVLGKVQAHQISRFKAQEPAQTQLDRKPRERKEEEKPKETLAQVMERFRNKKR